MSITSTTLRAQIIQACQQLEVAGLNRGTSGNISCREGDHFLTEVTIREEIKCNVKNNLLESK